MYDVLIVCISRGTVPSLAAIFLLALDYTYNAGGNMFLSHSCHVQRFVELQNIEML